MGSNIEELTFYAGDYIKNITIIDDYKENWWYGECSGLGGFFPSECISYNKNLPMTIFGEPEEIDAACDVRDEYGQTPLHIAALHGHCDVVSRLLSEKANINAQDRNGWTPLHCATR